MKPGDRLQWIGSTYLPNWIHGKIYTIKCLKTEFNGTLEEIPDKDNVWLTHPNFVLLPLSFLDRLADPDKTELFRYLKGHLNG